VLLPVGIAATTGLALLQIEAWWVVDGAQSGTAHEDVLWLLAVWTVGRGLSLLDRMEASWMAGRRELHALGYALQLGLMSSATVLVVAFVWSLLDLPSVALASCVARALLIGAIGGACRTLLGRRASAWMAFAALAWLIPALLRTATPSLAHLELVLETRGLDARDAAGRALVWGGLASLFGLAEAYRRCR